MSLIEIKRVKTLSEVLKNRQIRPLIYRPHRGDRREGKVSLLMDGRRAVVPIEMIAAYKAPKYHALFFIP